MTASGSASVPAPIAVPPLPAQRLLVDVPPHYDLVRLVQSAPPLAPLVFDSAQSALQAVLYPLSGTPIEVLIHQIEPGVPLLVYGIPEGSLAEPLAAQLQTMLSLDEDLAMFYALCEQDEQLAWVCAHDAARCLRAPTMFEDLVKCQIRSRVAPAKLGPIVSVLCAEFGARTNLARAAFPTAQALAKAPARFFERKLGEKALATPLRALSEHCASGVFYPESLRRPPRRFSAVIADEERFDDMMSEELEWQFRVECLLSRLPGFSPKACDLLLPLIGCYDRLLGDMSTLRAWQKRFAESRKKPEKLLRGQPATEKIAIAMARRVAPYSLYGGLAQRLLLRDGVW